MSTLEQGRSLLAAQTHGYDVSGISYEIPQGVTRMVMRVFLTKPAYEYGPAIGLVLNDGMHWELTTADGSDILIIEKWQDQIGLMMVICMVETKMEMRDWNLFIYQHRDGVTTITDPRGNQRRLDGSLEQLREYIEQTHVGHFLSDMRVFE